MNKRIILWAFYAFVILAAIVYAPAIPLPFCEAILIWGLFVLAHVLYEKNTSYKVLRATLSEKKQILDDVFRNVPDLIYCKDKNLKYFSVNKAFINLHGGDEYKIVGHKAGDFIERDYASIDLHDEEVFETGESVSYEHEVNYDKFGKKYFYSVKTPLFDDNGEIYGLIGISRDITIAKEIEMQKDNFVETLTHDLKAPTTAQIKALELVLHDEFGELHEEQREILSYTLNSCKYMLNMILNILSTYKYDKGVKTLTLNTFDFKKLIYESVNELKYLSEDKDLRIAYDIDENLPMMNADMIEIKRVIVNLVSNAIFYALQNTEIKIMVSVTDDNFVFKIYTDSNNLSQEEIANLFEKFFTGLAKFRPVGTGLGLYLSKQIITAHGGEMLYEANYTNGNTFGFTLPVD